MSDIPVFELQINFFVVFLNTKRNYIEQYSTKTIKRQMGILNIIALSTILNTTVIIFNKNHFE